MQTLADLWILYYVLALVSGIIGFFISRYLDPMDGYTRSILYALKHSDITYYDQSEEVFNVVDICKEINLSREIVEKRLDFLARSGVIVKRKGEKYSIQKALMFLVERDYQRAKRITKYDNLLYGGYQEPFLSFKGLFSIYFILGLIILFDILVLFLPPWYNVIGTLIPPFNGLDNPIVFPFLFFTTLMAIVIKDVLENVVKARGRERYSVIVGEASGISFDIGYADEFSGRIPRSAIKQVFLDISLLQKVYNYFAPPPRGVVKIKMDSKIIVFFNMPYPRELCNVIRNVRLRKNGRITHTRRLKLWKNQTD